MSEKAYPYYHGYSKCKHPSSSKILVTKTTKKEYIKKRKLGQGGFAVCYKVERVQDGKKFAMKVVEVFNSNEKSVSRDYKSSVRQKKISTIQKVQSQVSFLKSLNHPNIVKYETHFIQENQYNIVMELCQNGSLSQLLKKRKMLTEVQARYFFKQMIKALQYLKSKNIIHRDLKPGNFLIDGSMTLKICDFGLAVKVDYNFFKNRSTCGTPNYISPQMLMKKQYSYEVDVWSLGVILYTMLYGIAPFQTKNKVTSETYDLIKKCQYNLHGAHVSDEAKDLIKKILVSDRTKRIKLEEMLAHPFIANYPIPCYWPDYSLFRSEPKQQVSERLSINKYKRQHYSKKANNKTQNIHTSKNGVQSIKKQKIEDFVTSNPLSQSLSHITNCHKKIKKNENEVINLIQDKRQSKHSQTKPLPEQIQQVEIKFDKLSIQLQNNLSLAFQNNQQIYLEEEVQSKNKSITIKQKQKKVDFQIIDWLDRPHQKVKVIYLLNDGRIVTYFRDLTLIVMEWGQNSTGTYFSSNNQQEIILQQVDLTNASYEVNLKINLVKQFFDFFHIQHHYSPYQGLKDKKAKLSEKKAFFRPLKLKFFSNSFSKVGYFQCSNNNYHLLIKPIKNCSHQSAFTYLIYQPGLNGFFFKDDLSSQFELFKFVQESISWKALKKGKNFQDLRKHLQILFSLIYHNKLTIEQIQDLIV